MPKGSPERTAARKEEIINAVISRIPGYRWTVLGISSDKDSKKENIKV